MGYSFSLETYKSEGPPVTSPSTVAMVGPFDALWEIKMMAMWLQLRYLSYYMEEGRKHRAQGYQYHIISILYFLYY